MHWQFFSSRNASSRRNMSKFCDVIIFLSSFNYTLLWNAVLRLSDIPLQAIGGAKKQCCDCYVVICESTASPAHWSVQLTLNDMKNQLLAYFLLPQKKKPLLHLIGHCLFCKTAAVGKGQVDRNTFHSFRLFCQKLTSYQICFQLEMKGITCRDVPQAKLLGLAE